ncbi:MAG: MBOAT family protein [Clostridia bacterium]|nr:MBOAT family protein [Clostridia bacterium]
MSLNSLFFVFLFLPAGWILQRVTPEKAKNAVLLLLSAAFITWGSPRDMLLILCSALFNFFTALELTALQRGERNKHARLVFISGVTVNLLLLFFYKYTGFALSVFGAGRSLTLPLAPVGISFYTFSAVSFLTDVYRGDTPAPKNFIDAALYLTFFPKFISGPIVKYADFEKELRGRVCSAALTEAGVTRFTVGLAKKLVLADSLAVTFNAISALPTAELTVVHAWLGLFAYAFMLYFDFSGYSDMAVGLGNACGFHIDENFDRPYTSVGIADFWRRWHITLGRWFRDYVYIPLGGSRQGKAKTVRNLAVVWLLTGLWHGAAWTFVAWGAYHLALLLLEKFVFAGLKKKLPKAVNVALTFLLVILGWTPFFSPSLSYTGMYLLRLVGVGGAGLVNGGAVYLLRGGAVWLALAAVGSTPLPKALGDRLKDKKAFIPLKVVLLLSLLALSLAAMISGTYQSFLYAQF